MSIEKFLSNVVVDGTISKVGGTSTQFLKADGSVDTNVVPYTGAIQNVDLGEYQLKAGQLEFDQTPTGTTGVAILRWNDNEGTLDLGLKGGNVTLQLGQEQIIRIVNKTGVNLLESAYQVIYISGAQGNRLKVDLALANSDLTSAGTIGLVTETINDNEEGFITSNGLVRGINTTGSIQGETWVDGDILYVSSTVAGRLTNIKPTAPQHSITIGICVSAHITQGSIFVKVDNGYELEELHNVLINTPVNNQILTYESATSLWKNKTVSEALGFTPENITNKSDSYTVPSSTTYASTKALVDGLTTKSNDANVVHKTGDETKSGKLNLSNVNLYLVPSPIFSGLTDTGVAGNLNGLYYYSVNYYNALGETDTSGEQSISVTNKQVSVTLPISPNTSVIGRRLYRTVANAFDPVIKYLVADIPNNTATSYVDNIIDGSLGVPVPRVNTTGGQLFNNADRVGFASGGTTSFGLNSALQSTGYANSSFGFGSLTDNTTGYRNTAGGVFSMYKNTTGYNNTGWGVHSLNDNTTGWDNSAFGFSALISNTTGISNSAFGTFALSQNLTGSNNVAVGPSSLQYNTAGNNTAVGYNSLQNNTTGSGNIGLGYQAGRDNSTGNFNIVIGQSALEKMNDAWFTTAIGFQTGFNATSLAWSNTFIGAESGYNASGGNNVFLGKAAGYYETGSNKLFIDNQQRANESDARISALIYGEFNATVSSQQLAVNGNLKAISLNLSTAPTTSAGTYDILTRNTSTGVVEKVANIRPYKIYVALLSQVGTSAPTATVLENTLGGTVVWSRGGTGSYTATLTGAFTASKTVVFITNGAINGKNSTAGRFDNNGITVSSNGYTSLEDTAFVDGTIEIRVYN